MLRGVSVAVLAFALFGCSDSSSVGSKQFQTKGLVPPSTACSADPAQLGDAQKITDIDLGNGCFVHNAYAVNSLAGVNFNQTAKMNCAVAATTAQWLETVVQPAAEDAFGERVVKIDVPSAFSCRPRNNKRGAKLSEHGMGNAVDVSAFTLESGRKVTVEQGWFSGNNKSFIKAVRAESCGLYKTVLGPGSDGYHEDHIHLDLQKHRSGSAYCR